AFGDFNKDQHTDLFLITPDQHTVQLWTWQNRDKAYAHLESADITVDSDLLISNVIPGDFDMDGNLDLIVQGQKKKDTGGELFMQLYLGDSTKGFAKAGSLPPSTGALPFAFDYNGDARVDLLGVSWDQRDNASAPATWTSSTKRRRDAEALFSLRPFDSPSFANSTAMCKPASPHSSAFVDLDGDCLADLFIVCEGSEEYQIWTNSPAGFVYSQTGKLPSNAGPVSFADINADGSLDMVIPILGKPQIYVMYNKQRPLCVGVRKQGSCRKFDRICEADPAFSFSLADAQILDISNYWPGEVLLDSIDDFQGQAPPAIRLADFNLDGFPDMAFITKQGKKDTHVRLLKSVKCTNCTSASGAKVDWRWFTAVSNGVAVLEKLGRPQDVAFFDIDNGGTVDMLVYYLDAKGEKRIAAIYNNFFTDAFFVKALVCPSDKHVRSYVGYLPGPSFKYLLVSDSGKKHVAQSLQVPQTAYRALYTPYTIIGIGRTNNYIEDFSVGSTSQMGRHERSFEGLIPNSQVVVFPSNTTGDWRLELYMNRSQSTPYILATLLSSMGLLAITVFALGSLERRADQREKQRALHSINFDAL
ncbi:hypothetical protein GQ54DRAFT_238898, partial [Martensiomyces pterosporus]